MRELASADRPEYKEGMKKYAVIGAGGMGTACAILLARKREHQVSLWCRDPLRAAALERTRVNDRYLPGNRIPDSVRVTADIAAIGSADVLVLAVPMVHLPAILADQLAAWPAHAAIVSVVKGVDQTTFQTTSQMIESRLGPRRFCALTGPSHAEELAQGKPAAVLAAAMEEEWAAQVQEAFGSPRFRIYRSTDLRGAELAGALKNVIAIAGGICDGLELGDNAKSALVTRGLAEMVRLGTALGGRVETFYGLAGVGDLLTTCMSRHSRNRRVGQWLGEGKKLPEILAASAQVAEGIWTARGVHRLAGSLGIDCPLTDAVYQVLFENIEPLAAAESLMARDPRAE